MPITDPYSTDQYSPYTGSPVPVRTYEDRIFGRLTKPYPVMNYFQSQPYTYNPNQIVDQILPGYFGGSATGAVGTGSTGTTPTGTIPAGTTTGTTTTGTQQTGTQPAGTQSSGQSTGGFNPYSLITPLAGTAYNVATGNLNIGDINSVGSTLASLGGTILGGSTNNPALGSMVGETSKLLTNYLQNTGMFSPNAMIGATAGESVVPGSGNLLTDLTSKLGDLIGYPLGTGSSLDQISSILGGGMNPGATFLGAGISNAIMPDMPKIEGAGGYVQSAIGMIPVIGPVIAGMLGGLFGGDQPDPLAVEGASRMNAILKLQEAVLQQMNTLAATPEGQAILAAQAQSGSTTPEGWVVPEQWQMPSYEQYMKYYDSLLGEGWETGMNAPEFGYQGMWENPVTAGGGSMTPALQWVNGQLQWSEPTPVNAPTREQWWSQNVLPDTWKYDPTTGTVHYMIQQSDPTENEIAYWLQGDISQDALNLYNTLGYAPAIEELQKYFMYPLASGIMSTEIPMEGGSGSGQYQSPITPIRPETLALAKLIFPDIAKGVESSQAAWEASNYGLPTQLYEGQYLAPGTGVLNPWSTEWQFPYENQYWDKYAALLAAPRLPQDLGYSAYSA